MRKALAQPMGRCVKPGHLWSLFTQPARSNRALKAFEGTPKTKAMLHVANCRALPKFVRRTFSSVAGGPEEDGALPREEFDYVVVGAGSAGCVLANRLTEDGKYSVLLLEYGDSDRADPRDLFLHMPTALSIPMNMNKYNWGFESQPEPHLEMRRMHCPRGKVLGGSSSINGMVFVRGHAKDFDHWQSHHGAQCWDYQHCLPYFKKMETWNEGESSNDSELYRGQSGPLAVRNGYSLPPYAPLSPFLSPPPPPPLLPFLSPFLSRSASSSGPTLLSALTCACVCVFACAW